MRAQAVPIAAYRRGIALSHARRHLILLAAASVCVLAASPSPLSGQPTPRSSEAALAISRLGGGAPIAPALYAGPMIPTVIAVESAEALEAAEIPQPEGDVAIEDMALSLIVAEARASTSHLDEAGMFNALNAISFVDGVVVPASARFVFDDVARTWDYREDPS